MSLFDYYRQNPNINEKEKNQRLLNAQIFGTLGGKVHENIGKDVDLFNDFVNDYSAFSINQQETPMNFLEHKYRPEAEKEYEKRRQLGQDWLKEFIRESEEGTTTEEQDRLYEEHGVRVKPWMDPSTGDLTTKDLTPWTARDYTAYGPENMSALSTLEQASIFNVIRLYSGPTQIFSVMEEHAPELFKIEKSEQEYIDYNTEFEGSWARNFKGGRFEIGENVVAWFGNRLPPDVLGELTQEKWDGEKGWELLNKYHPGFSAYLETEVRINLTKLINTSNQYQFRNQITDAVQSAAMFEALVIADKENSSLSDSLVFVANFGKQSFRSADMPAEMALTAVTLGGYGLLAAGAHGVTAYRTVRRINRGMDIYDTATDIGRATSRLSTALRWTRNVQISTLPSNWGHIAANGFKLRGLTWGHKAGSWYAGAGRMALIDGIQGTIEGFLYGLQNQLTDNAEWSSGRLWEETWSEMLGQMVFGKAFRGANMSLGGVVHLAHQHGTKGIWNKLSKGLDPNLKAYIETTLKIGFNERNLSSEQMQMKYLGAILEAQQNIGYGMLVGDRSAVIPPTIVQLIARLREEARVQGGNIDTISIMEQLVQNIVREQEEGADPLSETDAQVLFLAAIEDNLARQGITLDPGDQGITNILTSLLVEQKLKEKGASITDPNYNDVYRKVWEELAADPEGLKKSIDMILESAKELQERFSGMFTTIITGPEAKTISLDLLNEIRDDNGITSSDLLEIMIANIDAVANLNIDPAVIRSFISTGRATTEPVPTTEEVSDEVRLQEALRKSAITSDSAPAEVAADPAGGEGQSTVDDNASTASRIRPEDGITGASVDPETGQVVEDLIIPEGDNAIKSSGQTIPAEPSTPTGPTDLGNAAPTPPVDSASTKEADAVNLKETYDPSFEDMFNKLDEEARKKYGPDCL